MGFKVHATLSDKRNVVKIMLSFAQVLFDLELSPLESQTIKIKLEIDTNPPQYAKYETVTYRSFVGDYMIHTHDLSTGFSGKIGAVLHREYQKGRDFYDLQWYLQCKPKVEINLSYLNANCEQQKQKIFKNVKEVIDGLEKKLKTLDIPLLRRDLERFVTMDLDNFNTWLNNYVAETTALLHVYQATK